MENDMLEAVIGMPDQLFYNTGISTYVWIVTNRKHPKRAGKVQLINGTDFAWKMKKSLGDKRKRIGDGTDGTPNHIAVLTKLYGDFKHDVRQTVAEIKTNVDPKRDQAKRLFVSKIFTNREFGYLKITVERPLRLATHVTPEALVAFKRATTDGNVHKAADLLAGLAGGPQPHMDFNVVQQRFAAALKKADVKLRGPDLKAIWAAFTVKDEAAEPVIKKKAKDKVEYEPDPDLRDTEQIPLLEDGGIDAFFRREVLPHVPDAWIDESKSQTGYEISFTRYFYQTQPLRTLDEIRADLESLQAEAEGLLDQILRGGER
ncbi:MAG: N-6 DNA methylase [Planctomycetota bacterium]